MRIGKWNVGCGLLFVYFGFCRPVFIIPYPHAAVQRKKAVRDGFFVCVYFCQSATAMEYAVLIVFREDSALLSSESYREVKLVSPARSM